MTILLIRNSYLVWIAGGYLGFTIMPMLAVGLDFGCEVSYPVQESISSGCMISYSQLISAIHVISASFILSTTKTGENGTTVRKRLEGYCACSMLAVCIVIALGCATFTKEDLRKTKLDVKLVLKNGELSKA